LRIRIALDAELADLYGPEIHWTWRVILSTIGIAWEQVPLTQPCDIAFVSNPATVPQASFCIKASPDRWANPTKFRFQSISGTDDLSFPIYQHDSADSAIYRTSSGQWVCNRDVVFDLFWLTTGQEERYLTQDKHGFFDLTSTLVFKYNLLQQALGSSIIQSIATWLERLGFHPTFPRWHAGKSAAACIGHDVDYPEVIRWLEPVRILRRRGLAGLDLAWQVLAGKRHHWQFLAWAEMEKQLQTRSAFYFVARYGSLMQYAAGVPDPFYDVTSKRFRELFSILLDDGFEIGMQASYLAYTSCEKFRAEKQKIEKVSGTEVAGNRHHYWHLNPRDVEETLWIHEQIGLRYDASLTHDHYLGWRRGLLHPYFPFHQQQRCELKTLQIPTGWMDDQLFGQKHLNPGERMELLHTLANRVAALGGCLMIDVHDYVFDDRLFPGWARTLRELWEHLLHRGDFWFATPAQVAQSWSDRYLHLVRSSHGLDQGLP
jgi:hypothetical protein